MLESLITIPHIYYFFSCHYIFWPVNCTPEKYAILRQKMHQNNDMSWLIWTVLITLNHARNSIDQIEGFDASLLLIAVLGRAVLATCGNYGLRRGIVINSGSVIIIKSHIHSHPWSFWFRSKSWQLWIKTLSLYCILDFKLPVL